MSAHVRLVEWDFLRGGVSSSATTFQLADTCFLCNASEKEIAHRNELVWLHHLLEQVEPILKVCQQSDFRSCMWRKLIKSPEKILCLQQDSNTSFRPHQELPGLIEGFFYTNQNIGQINILYLIIYILLLVSKFSVLRRTLQNSDSAPVRFLIRSQIHWYGNTLTRNHSETIPYGKTVIEEVLSLMMVYIVCGTTW